MAVKLGLLQTTRKMAALASCANAEGGKRVRMGLSLLTKGGCAS